jgi:hypothetical protein
MRLIEWATFVAFIVGLCGPALLALLWIVFLVGSLFNPSMWDAALLKSALLVLPGVLLASYILRAVVWPTWKSLLRESGFSTAHSPALSALLIVISSVAFEYSMHDHPESFVTPFLSFLCIPFAIALVVRPRRET